MLRENKGAVFTALFICAFIGFLVWAFTGPIAEEEREIEEQEAKELQEAEERCNTYADGTEWFLDFEYQWGTDEWVCTFMTENGPEQIRWPER